MTLTILAVHNRYLTDGGEDESFKTEVRLLRDQGNLVEEYVEDNRRIDGLGAIRTAVRTIWSQETYQHVRRILRENRYDLVYVQNFFPLISPAVYYAARAEGVVVIQTLRNYRLMCVNSFFFRDGRVCEDCLGRSIPWPGLAHACYRDSRAGSAVVASMITSHRLLRTWVDKVDRYIALTEFSRQKFIEGGLPPEKIAVKPNFVYPDPGPGTGGGGYALYVGRLSQEKGISTLLSAWRKLDGRLPLKIVGDGPLNAYVEEAVRQMPGVTWVGRKPSSEVQILLSDATLLVFPSEWYENMPRVLIEAFASGTPVIASNLGAASVMVQHGRTGRHFRPADPEDLAAQVEWFLTHPHELAEMRQQARDEFVVRYAAEQNYRLFLEIYRAAAARYNSQTNLA